MLQIAGAIVLALILLPAVIYFLPIIVAAIFTALGMVAWIFVAFLALGIIISLVMMAKSSMSFEGRERASARNRIEEKNDEKKRLSAEKGITGEEYRRLTRELNSACNLPEDTPAKKKAKVKKIKDYKKKLGWEGLERF